MKELQQEYSGLEANTMDRILFYRNDILPISETFIAAQALALSRFEPVFTGVQRLSKSLSLTQPSLVLTDTVRFGAKFRKRLYRLTGFAPEFDSAIRKLSPKLIHAHFATDGVTALPLREHLQIPLVVTLYGYDVTMHNFATSKSIYLRRYLKRQKDLWRITSKFICISEFIRQKAIEGGFPEEKLCINYLGIDCKTFVPRGPGSEEHLVLFVGRLVEKKGCEYLLKAMRLVQHRDPAARVVVIGDGPLGPQLRASAGELGINCTFLGAQSSAEVRQWLRRATVFCAPSITAANGDSEGLGVVFLEAQAMGVPVVSSLHGPIAEAVCHGETGLLAPERDIEALAVHILTFLENPSFRESCSIKGPEWVRSRFDLDLLAKKQEQIYMEVLRQEPFRELSSDRALSTTSAIQH
jgi:glycosyltransferase involved in cell wall biosynthesis